MKNKEESKEHRNGCGIKGMKFLSPDFCFTEACCLHDDDYKFHSRTKADADNIFRERMVQSVLELKTDNAILKKSLIDVAYVYYYAVKYGGHIPYYVFKWFNSFKLWIKDVIFNMR